MLLQSRPTGLATDPAQDHGGRHDVVERPDPGQELGQQVDSDSISHTINTMRATR